MNRPSLSHAKIVNNLLLSLVFDISSYGFWRCFANGTNEVTVTPESVLFPEMMTQPLRIPLPEIAGAFLLEFPDNRGYRYVWWIRDKHVNAVLVRFHYFYNEIGHLLNV